MTKKSATIVFFGNERLATGVATDAPTLRSLIEDGYNVAAVISHNDQTRSRNTRELEIQAVANEYDIPLLLPDNLHEIKQQLTSFGADIGVLVAYGKIVPQSIIDVFPHGIINIHPSLLPLHRGPTPIESVMLSGERKTGVTIMQLAKEMDAGPIFTQQEINLTGHETKQDLATHLLHEGSALLRKLLPDMLDDSLFPQPQDSSKATYDKLLEKQDGVLDWQKSAEQLEREIRAFAIWPKSRTQLANVDVIVTAAHVVGQKVEPGALVIDKQTLVVGTSENALSIDTLVPAGKNEMPIAAFLMGYGRKLA